MARTPRQAPAPEVAEPEAPAPEAPAPEAPAPEVAELAAAEFDTVMQQLETPKVVIEEAGTDAVPENLPDRTKAEMEAGRNRLLHHAALAEARAEPEEPAGAEPELE